MALGTIRLSLRTDAVGGSIDPFPNLGDFASLKLTSRRLVLLIHGYNNTLAQAQAAYEGFFAVQRKLAGLEPEQDFAPDRKLVEVFWHGDDPSEGALFYPKAIGEARQSADVLADALATAAGGVPFDIDVVAHSLGVRLAFEFLRFANGQRSLNVRRLVLMAGAVPLFMLEDDRDAASLRMTYERSSSSGCLSLYSEMDAVLAGAFPLGQLIASGDEGVFPVALGRAQWSRPQCLRGFEQRDNRGAGHSDYWGHLSGQGSGHEEQARFASNAIRDFLGFPCAGIREAASAEPLARTTETRRIASRSPPDRIPEAYWL